MKSRGQLTGILLVIIMTGSITLNAQRGTRGKMDSTRMQRQGREYFCYKNDSLFKSDSLQFRGMRHAYGPGTGIGNMHGRVFVPGHMNARMQGRGFVAAPNLRSRKGMPPMHAGMKGIGFRPEGKTGVSPALGAGRLENLPSLNDKQKEEIADLKQKQIAEMKKIREDMVARMQVMRDEHRKNILDILTDEQKKQVEAGAGNTKAGTLK